MNVITELQNTAPLQYNENLQYIRAFAAISVMLYHAAHYVRAHLGAGLYDVFHHFMGLYGVAIFFALSGYLMAELSRRQNPTIFLTARIIRIYPVLMLATMFAVLSDPFRVGEKFDWISITLIPAGHIFYSLNVEWTLVHEMFFYMVVFGFIYLKIEKFLPIFGVFWIVVLIARYGNPMPRIGQANISEIFYLTANAGFSAGLIIPAIVRRIPKMPLFLVIVFLISIPITFWVPAYYARISSGIGSAFLVAAALQYPTPIFNGITARVFKKLGDWSYAMYLIHVPVILIIVRQVPVQAWPEATYLLSVVASTLASIALGKADIKIHHYTRNAVRGMDTDLINRRVVAFVLAYLALSIVWLT
ncbi:acyltransferase [Ochrobactrum sp. RH2CCR150]|uniref:acyltransferase family protein n=1 Tax=Ochrobactrum sp. RH2CCR150 TaxID=2587044 RepID=UPI0015FCE804|nr:peptidoglycan/LPS O-acetylase OafA/YrhL [Ochrobactrum sp. RH2CCR150]